MTSTECEGGGPHVPGVMTDTTTTPRGSRVVYQEEESGFTTATRRRRSPGAPWAAAAAAAATTTIATTFAARATGVTSTILDGSSSGVDKRLEEGGTMVALSRHLCRARVTGTTRRRRHHPPWSCHPPPLLLLPLLVAVLLTKVMVTAFLPFPASPTTMQPPTFSTLTALRQVATAQQGQYLLARGRQFLLSGFPLRGGGDDYNPTPSSRDDATALYATTSRFAQSAVREEEEQDEDGGEKEPRPPARKTTRKKKATTTNRSRRSLDVDGDDFDGDGDMTPPPSAPLEAEGGEQDEDTTSSAMRAGKAEEEAATPAPVDTVASPPAIHPNLLEPQPEKEEDTVPDVMKVTPPPRPGKRTKRSTKSKMEDWDMSVKREDLYCRATVVIVSSGSEEDLASVTPFIEQLLTRYGDRIEVLHRPFQPEDLPQLRMLEIWFEGYETFRLFSRLKFNKKGKRGDITPEMVEEFMDKIDYWMKADAMGGYMFF